VALVDGELTIRQFQNERWNEPALKELMGRVSLQIAPDLNQQAPDSMPCRLRVVLRNGEDRTAECLYPPGHSGPSGLDASVVRSKFLNVSQPVLSFQKCEQVVGAVMGLNGTGSIETLMGLLRP